MHLKLSLLQCIKIPKINLIFKKGTVNTKESHSVLFKEVALTNKQALNR